MDAFLGLMGATCSVSLAFVIPALLHRKHVAGQPSPPGVHQPSPWPARVLITFGVLVAAVSVPAQLVELKRTLLAPPLLTEEMPAQT